MMNTARIAKREGGVGLGGQSGSLKNAAKKDVTSKNRSLSLRDEVRSKKKMDAAKYESRERRDERRKRTRDERDTCDEVDRGEDRKRDRRKRDGRRSRLEDSVMSDDEETRDGKKRRRDEKDTGSDRNRDRGQDRNRDGDRERHSRRTGDDEVERVAHRYGSMNTHGGRDRKRDGVDEKHRKDREEDDWKETRAAKGDPTETERSRLPGRPTVSGSNANPDASSLGASGGVYIPPFRLARMVKEVQYKSSVRYQRLTLDGLRKSIIGFVNKVNATNIKILSRSCLRRI